MDTLSLAMVPPPNPPNSSFGAQQHSHPSSIMDSVSVSPGAHADGVWVAPPEQAARQQPQVTTNISHLQPPPRSSGNFGGQARLNGNAKS